VTKLNKVRAIPIRLGLLTLLTLSLASAAFASCGWASAGCADGSYLNF